MSVASLSDEIPNLALVRTTNGKSETPGWKINRSRNSVWGSSENMGCDLCFFFLFATFLLFLSVQLIWIYTVAGRSSHHGKFYSFMFLHKISPRAVCVNGNRRSRAISPEFQNTL